MPTIRRSDKNWGDALKCKAKRLFVSELCNVWLWEHEVVTKYKRIIP